MLGFVLNAFKSIQFVSKLSVFPKSSIVACKSFWTQEDILSYSKWRVAQGRHPRDVGRETDMNLLTTAMSNIFIKRCEDIAISSNYYIIL